MKFKRKCRHTSNKISTVDMILEKIGQLADFAKLMFVYIASLLNNFCGNPFRNLVR